MDGCGKRNRPGIRELGVFLCGTGIDIDGADYVFATRAVEEGVFHSCIDGDQGGRGLFVPGEEWNREEYAQQMVDAGMAGSGIAE